MGEALPGAPCCDSGKRADRSWSPAGIWGSHPVPGYQTYVSPCPCRSAQTWLPASSVAWPGAQLAGWLSSDSQPGGDFHVVLAVVSYFLSACDVGGLPANAHGHCSRPLPAACKPQDHLSGQPNPGMCPRLDPLTSVTPCPSGARGAAGGC